MTMREDGINNPAAKTCSWLLEHDSYQRWLNLEEGLLWIRGNPGVGKSTLMKYALRECIQEAARQTDVLIASFFFHGRGSPLQKSPLGMFRSLLHQVLEQDTQSCIELTSIFKNKCNKQDNPGQSVDWQETELQEHLSNFLLCVSKTRPVRIYVDALDESGREAARRLVKFFRGLISERASSGIGSLSICFSCRHYPQITLNRGLIITVERENHDDITTYVRRELELIQEDMDKNDAQTLEQNIVKRSSGVFQWVVLVLPRVLNGYMDGKTMKEIVKDIQKIPEQLEDLYDEILRTDLEHRSESLQLMQWLCFSKEPLSIPELRFAMLVDADTQFKTLRECMSSEKYVETDKTMERRVISLSGGLVEITSSYHKRIPQFIHQSVKDYLVSGGIQALEESSVNNFIAQAHFRLSRSCIRYITMKFARSIFCRKGMPFSANSRSWNMLQRAGIGTQKKWKKRVCRRKTYSTCLHGRRMT